jgi:hypothetical protein
VPNFLPLLAERFARQRLTALARVEGLRTDARPIVLFLCVNNAGRSQMRPHVMVAGTSFPMPRARANLGFSADLHWSKRRRRLHVRRATTTTSRIHGFCPLRQN